MFDDFTVQNQSDESVMVQEYQEAERDAYSFFLECEVAEMMGFDPPQM